MIDNSATEDKKNARACHPSILFSNIQQKGEPLIIVTGGAGFIGSNIVKALNEAGEDKILIVDHLGQGEKWKNLIELNFLDYEHKDDFLTMVERGLFDQGV